MRQGDYLVFGRHAVGEALRSGRPISEVLMAKGSREGLRSLESLAVNRGISIQVVDRTSLDELTGSSAHQGIVCSCSPIQYLPLDRLLDEYKKDADAGHPGVTVALDGVQDPQNLGAIIRSLDSASVKGLILPARRACHITPAVEKASAGSAQHISISRVQNLVQAIGRVKESGGWAIGLAAEADIEIWNVDMTGPILLVFGGEGRGLRPLVARACDYLARIPMTGHAGSLNVSAACAVTLYEMVRQRHRQ